MSILIKNIMTMLPEDDGCGFKIETKNILVEGHEIKSLNADGKADKIIDGTGRLAMPGLINAHTHAYMSLFRNYADDMAFWEWLDKVQTKEDELTLSDYYWGTLLNSIEMIKTGTTCFMDMNIKSALVKEGPDSSCAGAALKSGLRSFLTRGHIGHVGEEYPEQQVREVLEEREIFKGERRVNHWFGPHAVYSCMGDNLQRIAGLAKERGEGINIHLSESASEVENCIKEYGSTPIKYCADLGIFDVPTIAAHCVYATCDDIKILKEHNVSVAINPKSNMKLGNGFAPVEKFLEAGVNVCIGTDSCASNNTQNMFSEMNAAALIYKGANKKAQCVSAEDVLAMATTSGAKAFGMEGQIGVIKEGALADIAILNIHEPQFLPSNHLLSALVYSATGREVESLIVDGEMVMEKGEILTMDVEEVYYNCQKSAERLGMFR